MKIEKKIRIGIIGCGGIANEKHLPSLKALSNVEMVAFCDLVLEKAAKEYGTIDVIHVLTSNKSHAKLLIASMKAGKHVMCEKPMAKTAADALEMVNVAKETGKKLTIGYQHRHKAESTYLKKAIDRGDLGEIYFAKATAVRRRGTPTWGVFLNEEVLFNLKI